MIQQLHIPPMKLLLLFLVVVLTTITSKNCNVIGTGTDSCTSTTLITTNTVKVSSSTTATTTITPPPPRTRTLESDDEKRNNNDTGNCLRDNNPFPIQFRNNNSSMFIPTEMKFHESIQNVTTMVPVLVLLLYFGFGVICCCIIVIFLCFGYVWIQRKRTYRTLIQCGLPTVYWTPKFMNYIYQENNNTVVDSAINNLHTTSSTALSADGGGDDDNIHSRSLMNFFLSFITQIQQRISSSSSTTTNITQQQQQQQPMKTTTTTGIKKDKLSSSSITNILPRMQQYQGSYGMYGTVYGFSTAVVHVAHPIPALRILTSTTTTTPVTTPPPPPNHQNQNQKSVSSSSSFITKINNNIINRFLKWNGVPTTITSSGGGGGFTRSSSTSGAGTTKDPAYNHFKNFCGEGVFTTDGTDWKQKRMAVMHALIRYNAGTHSTTTFTSHTTTNDNNNNTNETPSSGGDNDSSSNKSNNNKKQNINNRYTGGYQERIEYEAHVTSQQLVQEFGKYSMIMSSTSSLSPSLAAAAAAAVAVAIGGVGGSKNGIEKTCTKQQQHGPTIHHHHHHPSSIVVNIIPILQRATLGLIYRYITHTELETYPPTKVTTEKDNNNNNIRNEPTNANIDINNNNNNNNIKTSPNKTNTNRSSFILSYLLSITKIRMIILAQSRSIWFLLPRWFYHTFSSMYQDEEEIMVPIRDLAYLACYDAKKQPTSPLYQLLQNDIYKDNMANRFKKNHDDDEQSNIQQQEITQQVPQPQQQSKERFSKNIIDEAITLLFAGQDTSAATLSWTIHLLSLYPHVQKKVAQEIRDVLDNNNTNNNNQTMGEIFVTKKHISNMIYLDAVVKEVMRLYPVAPFVVRKLPYPLPINSTSNPTSRANVTTDTTTANQVNNDPNVVLPSGSFCCIWIYSLHRNPDFWYQPNEFIPERWLQTSITGTETERRPRDKGITSGAYMPFAAGPRNCVGQPLAHIVLRSILATLLYHYEFRDPRLPNVAEGTSEDHDTRKLNHDYDYNNNETDPLHNVRKLLQKDMQAGFTVLPKDGVMVTVHKRWQ